MLRARARRPRTSRARCASVAPRAHHAVTGARHRLTGVAYARTAALAGCRSVSAPSAPGWEAGRLRFVGLFARVDAVRAAARGPCAHRRGGGRPSPPRCCVCPPAALAGCRSVSALPAPRRDAGRLRPVGLFTRVNAAQDAAQPCGDGRPSPPYWRCVCPPAALAGCRSVSALPAPRRDAGRLRPSASSRGSTLPRPLLSQAALALMMR